VSVAGISAPARNAVPVSIGDEVATNRGIATVQFRDGSNITLQPSSLLRIEGLSNRPVVRVVRGSATYDLAAASRVSVVNSRGETVSRILDAAVPSVSQPGSGSLLTDPLAGVAMFRASRQSGAVVPPTAAFSGVFAASGSPADGTGTAKVVLPNGLTLNLTATTTNGVTTYTVASIESTVGNKTLTITSDTTNSGLIGATVQGLGGVTQTGGSVNITLTPSGSTTPIPAATAQTAIQTNVNAAVQTAVSNGTLPAGTTPPTVSPVGTGEFISASAT